MLNKIKCLSVLMPTGMSAVMSILTLLFLTGCVGLESANSPKETFVLPRAYQEVYQLALVQARECWSDEGDLPVKGQLDSAARTAQVFVTNGLGSGRYGQVDIRALDDKNSEITVRLAGVNIWDAAALAAMHDALQFGVWTCTRYMPSARPANKNKALVYNVNFNFLKKRIVSEPFEPSTYFGLDIPYLKFLGVEPVLCADERAVTRLKIRDDLLNSRGHIHGGALMSLLDFTLSAAGRSVDPLGIGMATIDITVSCFEPAVTDLTIQARCLRRGSSIAFCEGEVLDTEGKLIAKASASFKVLKAKYRAKAA